ncbi:hypothetical protein FisN_31Hh044 [Fistulifera solaris]|uniref:Uncharacterized protein n=1 Tax=Fistulifera solaris TaxID=1519565 RepID=A0A1Z5JA26_FISSO|nr:hypothetical protein FisN_31Hh044 [Fistulifera solaris]|eukprot:GAX10837.1 hypothetical protein FisN_31Hh044 [Fistulifera solaris]
MTTRKRKLPFSRPFRITTLTLLFWNQFFLYSQSFLHSPQSVRHAIRQHVAQQSPTSVLETSSSSYVTQNVTSSLTITKSATTLTSIAVPATSKQSTTTSLLSSSLDGLSKFHQSILSRTHSRQGFLITGKYPLRITLQETPTRQWLSSTTTVYVNGTIASRSLASLDQWQWYTVTERRDMTRVELLAEIKTERPGYLQIVPQTMQESRYLTSDDTMTSTQDRLWMTGFSLAGRKGIVRCMDCATTELSSVTDPTARTMLWPNEVQTVPFHKDALLVCDGFLVPGKDRGGLYVVKFPGQKHREWTVSLTGATTTRNWPLTSSKRYFGRLPLSRVQPQQQQPILDTTNDRWFYHRAVWVDLTGDGRQSLLTARCQVSTSLNADLNIMSGIQKTGELIWLECPAPAKRDPTTGTPLDHDGTVFDPLDPKHLPWKAHVLASGPDVMFCVADMDPMDDTIEVLSSQFFPGKVSLHSIRRGPSPKVVFSRDIDGNCGAAFGSILADLDVTSAAQHVVVDSGSTVQTLEQGDHFSHLLVTSHECSYDPGTNEDASQSKYQPLEGGSLFAYRVPNGPADAWKTEHWVRTTVATGFKVKGKLGNMVNPGAPGFVYTFYAHKDDRGKKRPLIAVAGDCAESAFVFRPDETSTTDNEDSSSSYKLMMEIECGATL